MPYCSACKDLCSVCKVPSVAETISELLLAKQDLDTIAEASGVHRSTVHRHKKHCFPLWKAERLRAKRPAGQATGRLLWQFPAGFGPDGPREGDQPLFLYDGQPFNIKERRANDVCLRIEFEEVDLPALISRCWDEAISEDQARNEAKVKSTPTPE